MQIVIDILEDVYTRLFDNGIQDNEIAVDDVCEMARAIRLGTTIPKGHGRLIDSDDMIEDLHRQCKEVFKLDAVKPEDYYIAKDAKFMQATLKEWCDSFCVWANNRKTIVEADGGDA